MRSALTAPTGSSFANEQKIWNFHPLSFRASLIPLESPPLALDSFAHRGRPWGSRAGKWEIGIRQGRDGERAQSWCCPCCGFAAMRAPTWPPVLCWRFPVPALAGLKVSQALCARMFKARGFFTRARSLHALTHLQVDHMKTAALHSPVREHVFLVRAVSEPQTLVGNYLSRAPPLPHFLLVLPPSRSQIQCEWPRGHKGEFGSSRCQCAFKPREADLLLQCKLLPVEDEPCAGANKKPFCDRPKNMRWDVQPRHQCASKCGQQVFPMAKMCTQCRAES